MTTRTITVEALAAALADEPVFKAMLRRYGKFNSVWYEQRAAAIFATLPAEPAGDGLREALEVIADISESRVTVEQADALGYLDGYLAATPVGEVAALDVERLARALALVYGSKGPRLTDHEYGAAAIAAAYEGEK